MLCLVLRLPKIQDGIAVGVLMVVVGVCYLVNMFALILSPSLADVLFPTAMLPVLLGEGSLCLWLLVKGVNETKWRARVSAA